VCGTPLPISSRRPSPAAPCTGRTPAALAPRRRPAHNGGQREAQLTDAAIQQLISRALIADDVLDIFAASDVENPEISILSEQFLVEVARMPQKNLALEALRKLLNDEVKLRNTRNANEGRKFAEVLQQTINRYQNRSIDTTQAMQELMKLAREMEASKSRGLVDLRWRRGPCHHPDGPPQDCRGWFTVSPVGSLESVCCQASPCGNA
jgi:hypothetical protein